MIRYYLHQIRWYIGIALLLCLAITVTKYSAWVDRSLFGSSKQRSTTAQPSAAQPPIPATNGQTPVASFPATGLRTTTPVATWDASKQLAQAKLLLSEAANDSSKAIKAVQVWQNEVESMQDEPLGEATGEASEEYDVAELFDHLAYVMRTERINPAKIDEANSRVTSLQQDIIGLLNQSSPTALSVSEVAEISKLHETCQSASKEWQRDVRYALAIKHLLNRQMAPQDPATPASIGSKLSVADAQAALKELVNERMREQELAEQRKAIAVDRSVKKSKRDQQEAELLAKAKSPEVQALLAPFLEPRNMQPVMSGQTIKFRTTVEKQPISLAALQGISALGDSDESLKRLALLGAHRKLSGPTWSVRSQPHNWSDDDRAMLQQARQMLLDYGSVLVSEGQLSP